MSLTNFYKIKESSIKTFLFVFLLTLSSCSKQKLYATFRCLDSDQKCLEVISHDAKKVRVNKAQMLNLELEKVEVTKNNYLRLKFKKISAQKFQEMTAANIGKSFSLIFADKELISISIAEGIIGDSVVVNLGNRAERAQELCRELSDNCF